MIPRERARDLDIEFNTFFPKRSVIPRVVGIEFIELDYTETAAKHRS